VGVTSQDGLDNLVDTPRLYFLYLAVRWTPDLESMNLKKILFSITAILVVGMVVLLGLGLFGGSDGRHSDNLARIKVEYVLNKPPEEVFALISAHERYKEFANFDDSVLLEEGDTERNGLGALRRLSSGRLWFQERITCFERPKKMCYHVEDNSIFPLKHEIGEITIEPIDGKSRVTWVSHARVEVPLLGPFLARRMESSSGEAFLSILKGIDSAN
jgi:uncharacterized protein YndB with AHSA1/START domain